MQTIEIYMLHSEMVSRGPVVRHGSVKPFTAVRFRPYLCEKLNLMQSLDGLHFYTPLFVSKSKLNVQRSSTGFPLTLLESQSVNNEKISFRRHTYFACCKSQIIGIDSDRQPGGKIQKSFNVPGIAVAVIKDGKIMHIKGYGVPLPEYRAAGG